MQGLRPYPGQLGCYVFGDTTDHPPFPVDPVLKLAGFRLDSLSASQSAHGYRVRPLSRRQPPPPIFATLSWEVRSRTQLIIWFGVPVEHSEFIVNGDGKHRLASFMTYSDVAGSPPIYYGPYALERRPCPH